MSLVDTVANIGCVDRNSVQATGTDVFFLSNSGVRSFGRTVQEKSMPMRDISKNVRNDLLALNANQVNNPLRSIYSPEEAFYLLSFSDSNSVYCFDMRTALEDGSHRVTLWTGVSLKAFERLRNGTLYLGNTNGISTYSGFNDYGNTFLMSYFTNPLTFGDASKFKMLKEIILTVLGGQSERLNINWGYDYTQSYTILPITIDAGSILGYFAENEFESDIVARPDSKYAEYSASIIVDKPFIKTTGSGGVVTIGIDAEIKSAALSIQEVNIQATIGRII